MKKELYSDVRAWFVDWLEWNTEPVPLFWVNGSSVSPDVRITINKTIELMDAIQTECKNGNKKRGHEAINKNKQLIEIRTAIENEQHDISQLGYSIDKKYIKAKE